MDDSYLLTGTLRDVRRCYIDNTEISFLFGYVIDHVSTRYSKDDWFASSYIREVKIVNGKYHFYTANSVYLTDNYTSIIVSDGDIDNIRLGMPPEVMNSAESINDLVTLVGLTKKVDSWAKEYNLGINEIVDAIANNADELFTGSNDSSS